MIFPSLEALEGSARGVSHHSSPTGLTLPSEKASERLPHHHLGPGHCREQNTGTQWGCVLGSRNFSLPQGPSLRVEEALLEGSTRQAATVPSTILAPPWHAQHSQQPPLGREAPGCTFSPQALIPHLLPTAPSLFSRRGINSDASRLNWKPSSSSERSELWLILMSRRCP